MSDDERERLIDRQRDNEFSPRDRQTARWVWTRIIDDLVSPTEIRKRHEQHDDLWWAFGWVIPIFKSWKKLGIAAMVAMFIGGKDLVTNIVTMLGGMLP